MTEDLHRLVLLHGREKAREMVPYNGDRWWTSLLRSWPTTHSGSASATLGSARPACRTGALPDDRLGRSAGIG